MLKVLRENVKKLVWILWVVIGVFVLFVFVDFGGGLAKSNAPQSAAATVGNQKVTQAEFRDTYRDLEARYRQLYGEQFSPELAKQIRLPLQALDQLVNQKILLREAERLGLRVSDEELRDAILSFPVFKDDKGRFVGDATYRRILQQNSRTVDSFERGVRESLLLDKLNGALLANAFVSDKDVERSYRDQVERAKIRYVQLPRNRFLQGQVLPAEEVKAYFEKNKEQYRLPEQREVAYLVIDGPKLLNELKLDDAALRKYYDDHAQEFTNAEDEVKARHVLVMVNDQRTDAQAQQRIAEAKAKIEKGTPFAQVVQEYSDDAASKAQGGDLGFFGKNRMVKEFEQAAFGAPVGQLVGPVKSTFGYHLIEVTGKRSAGLKPFEEVSPQIRSRMAAEQLQNLAQSRAREIADRLKKDKPKGPESLEAVGKEVSGALYALSGKFGKSDPIPGLGFSPQVSQAAFALKKGETSEPVESSRGWAVLYLKDVHPPRLPELTEVDPRVRLALAQEKQQQMALQELNRVKQQIEAGQSFADAAKGLGLESRESAEFGGEGNIPGIGYNPQLVQAALALETGKVGGPFPDAQGAILFQVADRKSWNPAEFQAQKEQTRTTLEQQRLGRLLASLIEQRRRELGVVYERQVLEQFGLTGDPAAGGPAS